MVYCTLTKKSLPMIDSLVRHRVIPTIYPPAPCTRIPKKYEGRPLGLLPILKEALQTPDREPIARAAGCSYKVAKIKVGGRNEVKVPRESVYDSEMIRILSNWLQQERYKVTGQWHYLIGNDYKYSDIVINGGSKLVVELLATEDSRSIREHIKEKSRKEAGDEMGKASIDTSTALSVELVTANGKLAVEL